jgi:hypothetical protein
MLRDASISGIDNVEQVTGDEVAPAVAVVEAGRAFQGAEEIFALAHSGGFTERRGPDVAARLSGLDSIEPGAVFTLQARIENTGDVRGHGYEAALHVPAGYALVGRAVRQVGSLAAGESVIVAWHVRAPRVTTASGRFEVAAAAHCYGWTWSARSSATLRR